MLEVTFVRLSPFMSQRHAKTYVIKYVSLLGLPKAPLCIEGKECCIFR